MTDQSPPAEAAPAPAGPIPPAGRAPSRAWLKWLAPVLVVALLAAYGTVARMAETIDDDTDFGPGPVAERASRAVAMAAQLVFREVDQHKWVANDPFFQPSWALDDMPAFQQGIVAAVARFTGELNALAIRAGTPDLDLERAVGYFKYPGNVWMFDPSTSWAPTATTEKQYRSAARNLVLYNEQVATGEATFDRRPEALKLLLLRLGADLDAAAAELDSRLDGRSPLLDTGADDMFYATKGRLYAHALLLRELGRDYAPLLAQRGLGAAWTAMVESLQRAAALRPAVVINGSVDGALLPSHLAGQGFHLLRARGRLAAVAAAL